MFDSIDAIRTACRTLSKGDARAAHAVGARQAQLTKPPGSLGRLEEIAAWLGRWQARESPRLDDVRVLVFAGNHGVASRGVSAFPQSVTQEMVANFAQGGAAINQLAGFAGATLSVVPLSLELPTRDFTEYAALDDTAFLDAVAAGADAVPQRADLLCLGEMGIGNTTAAAAIAAALFGGGPARWVGRGTGIDDGALARKRDVVDAGLARHRDALGDPLAVAAALGGRELAALLGAALAARLRGVPVLLDGFVCTAAVAPLAVLTPDALEHTLAGHVSAEAAHRLLLRTLGLDPLLDLHMRLGEASGAALAVAILRAALACHCGMATFASAGVSTGTKAPA
jgi:nicotinate-nucleotide--dimethylbenzimidazole phosphoribosyltransferase